MIRYTLIVETMQTAPDWTISQQIGKLAAALSDDIGVDHRITTGLTVDLQRGLSDEA